ncbi:hypothetical protein L3X38_008718 [Prunus dulcis]|uniref:Disease resistance family protein / LRR family protein n=1 Tax=Prunus dulcis TaxID=3755 RepID=A0AAD4ZWY5_PRUDU|nr:hypothetical protein L3X38_008718 [Prunus dulcis]
MSTSYYKHLNVHKSVGDLKNLTSVNLKDCQKLKRLPKNFYRLKSVETLVLNGCSRFEILDEKLGKLVSLTTFLANKTAITEVPSAIVRLKKLEQLSLCDLKRPLQLPPSLRGLYSLTQLSLKNCNLSALPKDLGSLFSLERLDLSENSFHSFPNFSGLSNLLTLSLDECNLTDDAIDSVNLGSLSYLRHLGLQNNHFHTLPSLSGLAKLEDLYLEHCTNLGLIKDLPTSLELLCASHCTALERMPNFSEMSPEYVEINNCPKLIEFPGLHKALNSGMSLSMKTRNNISDILLEESMLQGWNGRAQLDLAGSDIPKWFKHVGEGGQVHFEVPLGCSPTSLAMCMVYSSCDKNSDYPASFCVINHTKRASFIARSDYFYETFGEDFLWVGHLSNYELNLEGGDSVHVVAEIPGFNFRVKKIGIRLVYDKFINEKSFEGIQFFVPYLQGKRRISTDDDDDDDDDEGDDDDDDDEDDDEAGPSHHTSKKMRLDPSIGPK